MKPIKDRIPRDGWYWCQFQNGSAAPFWCNSGEPIGDNKPVVGPILNPFENQEPIDGEWLEQIGFMKEPKRIQFWSYCQVYVSPTGLGDWAVFVMALTADTAVGVDLAPLPGEREFKTRYDLLNLLQVLGCEVQA